MQDMIKWPNDQISRWDTNSTESRHKFNDQTERTVTFEIDQRVIPFAKKLKDYNSNNSLYPVKAIQN